MLPQSRLDKISEMENLLNEAESFLADAEQFLEKWQAFLPKMKTLEHYYFDGDWRDDYQAYEDGKIPEDMPCGVLSEDLVFNLSFDLILSQRLSNIQLPNYDVPYSH